MIFFWNESADVMLEISYKGEIQYRSILLLKIHFTTSGHILSRERKTQTTDWDKIDWRGHLLLKQYVPIVHGFYILRQSCYFCVSLNLLSFTVACYSWTSWISPGVSFGLDLELRVTSCSCSWLLHRLGKYSGITVNGKLDTHEMKMAKEGAWIVCLELIFY